MIVQSKKDFTLYMEWLKSMPNSVRRAVRRLGLGNPLVADLFELEVFPTAPWLGKGDRT